MKTRVTRFGEGSYITRPNYTEFMNQFQHNWNILPLEYISKFGTQNLVLHMDFQNLSQMPQICSIPLFYQHVICGFNKAKTTEKKLDRVNILDQIIWGNPHFTYKAKCDKNEKCLFFSNWIKGGIIKVKDLKISENGKIDENYIILE